MNNRFLLTLSFAAQIALAQQPESPPLAARDKQWRQQELSRAYKLFEEKQDYTPVDEAFAAKDVLLLWHYYTNSSEIKMHRYDGERPPPTPEEFESFIPIRKASHLRRKELHERAGRYLKQIPGHARFLGDSIESMLRGHEGYGIYLETAFACLGSLAREGSDECIEQLSRFLYDQRDPIYMPQDPQHPRTSLYDIRGQINPMQGHAAGGLYRALKDKVPFVKSLEGKNEPYLTAPLPLPRYDDKLRAWWPTAPEVAAYRRSLAATGVVLPPGYPQMDELKGSACTIAPPLKNPPYPDRDPDAPALKPR